MSIHFPVHFSPANPGTVRASTRGVLISDTSLRRTLPFLRVSTHTCKYQRYESWRYIPQCLPMNQESVHYSIATNTALLLHSRAYPDTHDLHWNYHQAKPQPRPSTLTHSKARKIEMDLMLHGKRQRKSFICQNRKLDLDCWHIRKHGKLSKLDAPEETIKNSFRLEGT